MPVIRTQSNNKKGKNQHWPIPILKQYPDLPNIIQKFIDSNGLQKDIPEMLSEKHNIQISIHSVQRLMQSQGVLTTCQNGMDLVEQGAKILKCKEDDPCRKWGVHTVKEKLAQNGIHVSRDFINVFSTSHNPEAAALRHPVTCKVHHHGLHSAGPNEEWCMDGHEKILHEMGIAVWGMNDKYARVEIVLYAVPNAHLSVVPPALYLRTIRKHGGMPVSNTSDMGTELTRLIPVIMTLRQLYQPSIPEDVLPSHHAIKSVFNITREWGWHPIWEKELGNVLHEYKLGKQIVQFHVNDPIHE